MFLRTPSREGGVEVSTQNRPPLATWPDGRAWRAERLVGALGGERGGVAAQTGS